MRRREVISTLFNHICIKYDFLIRQASISPKQDMYNYTGVAAAFTQARYRPRSDLVIAVSPIRLYGVPPQPSRVVHPSTEHYYYLEAVSHNAQWTVIHPYGSTTSQLKLRTSSISIIAKWVRARGVVCTQCRIGPKPPNPTWASFLRPHIILSMVLIGWQKYWWISRYF